MDQTILANFNVTITSAENASWQGYVEINDIWHEFRSELQLLRCIMNHYPALQPNIKWDNEHG